MAVNEANEAYTHPFFEAFELFRLFPGYLVGFL